MRALRTLDGVIHVQVDHEEDRVHIWTKAESPDVSVFLKRIEQLGFKVSHEHTRASKQGPDTDKPSDADNKATGTD